MNEPDWPNLMAYLREVIDTAGTGAVFDTAFYDRAVGEICGDLYQAGLGKWGDCESLASRIVGNAWRTFTRTPQDQALFDEFSNPSSPPGLFAYDVPEPDERLWDYRRDLFRNEDQLEAFQLWLDMPFRP